MHQLNRSQNSLFNANNLTTYRRKVEVPRLSKPFALIKNLTLYTSVPQSVCRNPLVYCEAISGVPHSICNFSSKQAKMFFLLLLIDKPLTWIPAANNCVLALRPFFLFGDRLCNGRIEDLFFEINIVFCIFCVVTGIVSCGECRRI